MDDMISDEVRSGFSPGTGRSLFRALAGVGGIAGLGAIAFLPTVGVAEPDAGHLPPLRAIAAEESRVEVMGWGETFGGILYDANLNGREQVSLLDAFGDAWNPRRLLEGTEITIRYPRGVEVPRGVDVLVTRDTLLRIDREGEGWVAAKIPIGFTTDTLAAGGEIAPRESLWIAIMGNPSLGGVSRADRQAIVERLDLIFQSTVDFVSAIHPGDAYRFVLERQVRPDGSMRTAKVLSAEVESRGRPNLAVWFDVKGDGVGGYYDGEGVSIKRQFLLRPITAGRLSSSFSMNRMHPILDVRRPHLGTDFAAPTGTEVMATADGVITFRGVDGNYGNLVQIRHANGYVTRYAHLSRFEEGQRVGSQVTQGQVIGRVGMTGLATGPHVHYELHQDGVAENSQRVANLLPTGDPIPADQRGRWVSEFGARYAMLEAVGGGPDVRLAAAGARTNASAAGAQ